jgi:hypothetical protein
MNHPSQLLRSVIASALVSLLLTACASERVKAENKKAKENKEEYVDYYPVGSNIPVKIPKSQAKASEQESEQAQQAMRNVQRNGSTVPKDN